MKHIATNSKSIYIRNFIFGVQDSLVSTVGLVSGIAVTNAPISTIISTGVVLIFVEAFSMGAGSYLSEYSSEEYESHKEITSKFPLQGAFVMFASYLVAGFVILLPYTIMPSKSAFWSSIILSLIGLCILGIISGRFSHTNIWRDALRMCIVGGVAILVGVIVGSVL